MRLWPVPQDLQHWSEYVPGSVASMSTGTDSPFFSFQQSSPKMKARPGAVLALAPSGNALMCSPCMRSDEMTCKRTLSPTFIWITAGSNSKSLAVTTMTRGGASTARCGFSCGGFSSCIGRAELCTRPGTTNTSKAAAASGAAQRKSILKMASPVQSTTYTSVNHSSSELVRRRIWRS